MISTAARDTGCAKNRCEQKTDALCDILCISATETSFVADTRLHYKDAGRRAGGGNPAATCPRCSIVLSVKRRLRCTPKRLADANSALQSLPNTSASGSLSSSPGRDVLLEAQVWVSCYSKLGRVVDQECKAALAEPCPGCASRITRAPRCRCETCLLAPNA
jgi:hypothetical protein